jgi:ABC-type antimicrobial peptide transport system permease subunit
VGLYGVLAYSISRRTREIGLRVALGAERHQVLRLILGEAARIVLVGLFIGMFSAILVTRPLARFLVPGLGASDPATYLTVALVLSAVGCLASARPALRALRIDPMAALRHE